jgi:serine/threonine protein kinase
MNKLTGKPLAIKKVSDIFYNLIDAKRILRELHILSTSLIYPGFLSHKNVISLLDVVRIDDVNTFNEVYLVMELM